MMARINTHDFISTAESDNHSSHLRLEVTPQASTDNQATGAGQPNTFVAPQLQEIPGEIHLSVQAEDNEVDERTTLLANSPSGSYPLRVEPKAKHRFRDTCASGCSSKQIALIVILFIISMSSAALFLKFAKFHDSYLKQSAHPGDTVLLVKGLEPFWNSWVVVTEGGSVQNEWEVSLFVEHCVNLIPYYVKSHKSEPHNLTSDGEPVRILEHRSDLNNYFISGSVLVTLKFFITTSIEMDLCIFDNLQWYQDFYENPTQEAKQNAWEPCTPIFLDFQSTTVVLNYNFSNPAYYFIAVAPAEPVPYSLQYALDLQQEIYNHSDYEALNCSVTSSSKCDIPINGLLNMSDICILAFDPVLQSEDEDYIPLQVYLEWRVFNIFSIVFGSLCLLSVLALIVACILTLAICVYKFKKH